MIQVIKKFINTEKNRMLPYLLLMLVLSVGLGGCSIETDESLGNVKTEYSYYSLNNDQNALIENNYSPSEESTDYMLKDLMQRFGQKTGEEEQINLLPREVSINSYDLQENTLTIDFSNPYSQMSRSREILVREGLVKTFTQLPDITSLAITIDSAPLCDSRGVEIGRMTDASFVDFAPENLKDYKYGSYTLYFADKSGTALVTETRNVYYRQSLSGLRVALEQLIKGPIEKGHYQTISSDVQVLDVSVSDGICYIDFDQSFLDCPESVTPRIAVYSIVETALAASGAEKVQITVDGEEEYIFGSEINMYQLFS